MSEIILSILDPIKLIMLIGGLFIGMAISFLYKPTPSNQVSFMQPGTRSGYDFNVEKESALILYTEKVRGLPHKRFIKLNDGYTIKKGRNVFHRYLAREGSLFTTNLENPEKDKKISPVTWLKTVLGEPTYKELKQEYKEKIESAKIVFTVKVSQEKTTIKKADGTLSGINNITEDDCYRGLGEEIPQLMAEGIERSTRRDIFEKIAFIGTGIAIAMILWVLEVFGKVTIGA